MMHLSLTNFERVIMSCVNCFWLVFHSVFGSSEKRSVIVSTSEKDDFHGFWQRFVLL